MFIFVLTSGSQLQHIQTLRVSGNVLDSAIGADEGLLMLSLDSCHNPGSTTKRRELASGAIDSLQSFIFQGRELFPTKIRFQSAKDDLEGIGRLTTLLYGLENLRKRDSDTREDD